MQMDYIYVYGVRGKKKDVMVARVKPADFETFSAVAFLGWATMERRYKKGSQHITDRASNELSISLLPDGQVCNGFSNRWLGPRCWFAFKQSSCKGRSVQL